MAASSSTTSFESPNSDSDSDSNPNPNPNPNPSPSPAPPSDAVVLSGPALCLTGFARDSLSGALMGSLFGFGSGLVTRKGFKWSLTNAGSSAKTFAVLSGVHSLVACLLKTIRGKDDVINAGVAGCCTGLALSFPGAPQALLQSCVTFGAFSFIIEGLNKRQPAMALPFSELKKNLYPDNNSPPPMALHLQFPLPDELKIAFSSFCESLKKKPNKGAFPTAH